MKQRSVIIVGGGIGGLTLARFLVADGHRVHVIERAKDFSAQGHTIGMRGIGLQAMGLLGLSERVAQAGLNHRATTAYLLSGTRLRTTSYRAHGAAVGGIVVTQRGLLHAALHENLPAEIDLRFGVWPLAIRQDATAATVELSDGSTLSADIVAGVDGANSMVRRLVLPDVEVFDRGVYVGMTCTVDHGLPPDEVAAFYGKAQMFNFFPFSAGKTAAVVYQDLSWRAPPIEAPAALWIQYLRESFAGAAEPVRRTLAALQPGDGLFQDRIRQVPPRCVAVGRVALVGDAGYCASFFSGNGAGLAAAGAYCLSKQLAAEADDAAALKAYEAKIVPFAAAYHANADRLRSRLFTRSPTTIAARALVLRFMPAWVSARSTRRHYRGEVQLTDLA